MIVAKVFKDGIEAVLEKHGDQYILRAGNGEMEVVIAWIDRNEGSLDEVLARARAKLAIIDPFARLASSNCQLGV
ncbi:MAG: hypothetical protein QXY39_03405 [Thermofilaceae archaeon]